MSSTAKAEKGDITYNKQIYRVYVWGNITDLRNLYIVLINYYGKVFMRCAFGYGVYEMFT